MNASIKVAYDPSNFPELASIEERAAELMNRAKGGAGELRKKIDSLPSKNLCEDFQIQKPEGGAALRLFTLGELAESAEHEVTPQAVDPAAVEDILFGRYG